MSDPLIFATFLTPVCYKTYQHITEYIERSIKVPTFLLNGETLEDFTAAYVDAGFISPLSYMHLLNQQPCPIELLAAPIALGACDQDAPPVYFEVVVRTESLFTTMTDLKDCVWARYPGPSHAEDSFLHAQGAINFERCVEASTPARALRLVLAGKADATAIDVRSLSIAFHNSPRIAAGLRVVSVASPVSAPLAVVATHIHLPIRLKLQAALASIHRDPLLAQRLHEESIARFIPLTNQYYQRTPEGSVPHYALRTTQSYSIYK